jgi:GT2 family glycosyltransferase
MTSSRTTPRVTISLVTFNGMRWLPGCLASVRSQELADFECLVLDNGSTDGSVEWLRKQAAADARIRLRESAQNLGFAAAHNRLIVEARSEFVLLLNQDVELDPGFLGAAVAAFNGLPDVAAVQGRLRRLGPSGARSDVLDSTGLQMHRDRRVVARSQGKVEAAADLLSGLVWGADGPAPVYRRDALLDAREPRSGGGWEVLDEDFFMYKEDVDLAWRLRNLGWTAWYEPMALAWHARGASGNPGRTIPELMRADRRAARWIKAISWRNHRLMQVKNESLGGYIRELPWILRREMLSLGLMTIVDPRRLHVIAALVAALPRTVLKRRYLAGRERRIR